MPKKTGAEKPKKENCKRGRGKAVPASPKKENTVAGSGAMREKKAKRAGHTFKISMKSMIIQQGVIFFGAAG